MFLILSGRKVVARLRGACGANTRRNSFVTELVSKVDNQSMFQETQTSAAGGAVAAWHAVHF